MEPKRLYRDARRALRRPGLHEAHLQSMSSHQSRIDGAPLGPSIRQEHPVLAVVDVRSELDYKRAADARGRAPRDRDRYVRDEEIERARDFSFLVFGPRRTVQALEDRSILLHVEIAPAARASATVSDGVLSARTKK